MVSTIPAKVVLGAQDISHRFGAQPILSAVSLTLHESDRIGLIGHNGCGKSTLLRILAGTLNPDEGTVTYTQGIRTTLLEQQAALDRSKTVRQSLQDATADLRGLFEQWRRIHDRLTENQSAGISDAALEQECMELEHQLDASRAWDLDTEIKKISSELRLPDPNQRLDSLSGGELRRVDLAAKLLTRPDVLLLDEPTNHIDTESVAWIERFLENYDGAGILVTHDRYFLDRVVNRIVEINHGSLLSFPGNYERFLEYKASLEDVQQKTEANRQALIKRELEWYRRSPKARGTKARARIDRLQDAQAQGPPPASKKFSFAIPEPERLGKDILEAKLISHSYGDQRLFHQFSLYMQKGMRMGIMGPNGCGKSTLLRVLMGRETPDSGDVIIGATTRFLYVDQGLADMDPQSTVLEFVSEGQRHVEVGRQRIHVPSYLESFLFDKSCADMPLGRLSGGEKRRVNLAKKMLRGGNFIVFDEPTNDLDLYTLRVLEETIESFEGCALLVSHDRYLLNRLCTHMLIFEEDGKITQITGNYNDYLQYCRRRAEDEKSKRIKESQTKATLPSTPKPRAGLTYKEKKEYAAMEETILAAEQEVARLHRLVNDAGFYCEDYSKTQEVLQQLKNAEVEVSRLYTRWEALEAKQ